MIKKSLILNQDLLGILCGSIDIVLICFPGREEKRREEETRRREEETRRREEENSGGGEPRRLQSRLCVRESERDTITGSN
jgi:hypothetical protein